MIDQFSRTRLIYGPEAMARLAASRVLIVGVGGVGGYAVEALARSGVGTLALVDDDRICLTNLNRQILATHSSIGRLKVEAARERVLDINPRATVHTYDCFYLPDTTAEQFDFSAYDYIVDAVDTVKAKLAIVTRAKALGVPVISAMGAGNKIDPSRFRVADLYQTKNDPLARVMRGELRKRGIDSLKVVYSDEPPIRPEEDASAACKDHCICPPGMQRTCAARRDIPGSNAFVPAVAGLVLAGEVIADLTAFAPGKRRKGV